MGNGSRRPERDEVLRKLFNLAGARANDVVRLALLSENDDVSGLQLAALKEFKRGTGGSVEIKLLDRVRVLEVLLDKLEDRQADGLLQVLSQMGQEDDGTHADR